MSTIPLWVRWVTEDSLPFDPDHPPYRPYDVRWQWCKLTREYDWQLTMVLGTVGDFPAALDMPYADNMIALHRPHWPMCVQAAYALQKINTTERLIAFSAEDRVAIWDAWKQQTGWPDHYMGRK